MKKIVKALIVIGLIGLCAAGISVLVRNNSENNSSTYSGGDNNVSPGSNIVIEKIYIEEDEMFF